VAALLNPKMNHSPPLKTFAPFPVAVNPSYNSKVPLNPFQTSSLMDPNYNRFGSIEGRDNHEPKVPLEAPQMA
jgi:hypothetical protein